MAALALAVAGLVGLGLWQCRRGAEKQALVDAFERGLRAAPQDLTAGFAANHAPQWTRVHLHGIYVADREMLLDGQGSGEQPGFDVWTPLRGDDGALVIVDRGWLPYAQRSAVPAPPAGAVDVDGLWRKLPEPGMRLGADNCAAPNGGPRLVEYPTAADLRCRLGEAPVAGVVLLDASAPGGFLRDWHPAPEGFPPARHYAYAAQWFLLAATLLVLSIRFMLKSRQ